MRNLRLISKCRIMAALTINSNNGWEYTETYIRVL